MKNYLFCGFLIAVIITLSPIHAKATLSNEAQELKTLYEELQEFKDDSEFHRIGFGHVVFSRWMMRVKTLMKKTGMEIFNEVGFLPGELLQLGMEYMRSRGHPTSYSQEMELTIAAGLASEPQLEVGQGVIVTVDRACTSLDSFKKFFVAILANKFGEADAAISGSDCPRIYEKTVVTGPLASENLSLGDGSMTFHQVKMLDGTRLWVRDGQVEFRSKQGD